MKENIELGSVTTNNLKDLNVRFPLGEYTVVTGVSGSGKSSLVFDTLYGEAYRRYVESLSSFARQYLKAMPKPGVKEVRNLPPAIAVQQSRSGLNNRSTVGTLTEMIDIIRILFTHVAQIVCPGCGEEVIRDTPESVARKLVQKWPGKRVMITAPLGQWQKMKAKDLKAQLEIQGFTRLLVNGEVAKLHDCKATDFKNAAVIIDRITVSEAEQARLAEASGLAFSAGRGQLTAVIDEGSQLTFATDLRCTSCNIAFQELSSPAMLNFNHPLGACPSCQGFGRVSVQDQRKVIPDQEGSLATKGVACWNFGKHGVFYTWAKKSAKLRGIDVEKPFSQYTKDEWKWLYEGAKTKGDSFVGINGYFEYLDRKKYKAHYRIHAARYRTYATCPECNGLRLNKNSLAFRVMGESISEVAQRPVQQLVQWLGDLREELSRRGLLALDSKDGVMGLKEALEEGEARIAYLMKMGLSYLTLSRSAKTLSGGELQRINMARSLGSALTGTLFCLDEPSVGLHVRDSHNLLEVINELKDQGNTVVVVEHEKTLINNADHLIEIGPDAGHKGGEMVYAGTPRVENNDSKWISARSIDEDFKDFIELKGAKTHNLASVDAKIPVGHLTVVCGVSGSGKTSLVQHTLYPMLAEALGQSLDDFEAHPVAQGIKPARLIQKHREVVLVSQQGIGRSVRSNILTYLGILSPIRMIYASLPQAKAAKLTASHFSFNTDAGRCEHCRGLGTVTEDLSFLGEMDIICPECEGRRFSPAVLAIEYKGKSLIDLLNMTVVQAREFFYDKPAITKTLDAVIELGLGYVTLGQNTSSFSGGEAQRLKLLNLLKDQREDKPCILIFDEPTTGLSDRDVQTFLAQIKGLTTQGHTVIVIEHHLGVIRSADWLIEVGPEAAQSGGQIVYQGSPHGLKHVKNSVTARFL